LRGGIVPTTNQRSFLTDDGMRILTAQEKMHHIDDGKEIQTIDDTTLVKVVIGDKEYDVYIKYNSNLKEVREALRYDLMKNR
jgi:hypothetical protein